MIAPYNTEPKTETVVLVGTTSQYQGEREAREYIEELSFLTETAGGIPVKAFMQKIGSINPKTYIGSGKLAEIETFVKTNEVDIVIFDDDLTPTQFRNIEKTLGCKLLDRTNLILDIFAKRAKTSYARTQVELAQYEYLLPRLAGMWTHLERQRGGIGLRGPGEREIETDRRIIRDKIALLKEKLKSIDRQMTTQRKNREKMVRVALVGYTNVGKSTIMNLLSKSNVFAENKLFATLDTTVRKIVVGNLPFLLSDTVGFIRKLPHQLVESFKSTLDELKEADILLHIVDISHPSFEEQINVVNQTLMEINIKNKPVYMVFNKIDAFQNIAKDEDDLTPVKRENLTFLELGKMWVAHNNTPSIFISATKKTNITEFKKLLYAKVKKIHQARYPYDNFLY